MELIPTKQHSFVRYGAFLIDLNLIQLLMLLIGLDLENLFFRLFTNANLRIWADAAATVLPFMIYCLLFEIAECILLATLGTTPGKLAMGLVLTGKSGKKLSFRCALRRTLQKYVSGIGLGLFPVSIIAMVRSFVLCQDGHSLSWECNESYLMYPWKNAIRLFFVVLVLLLISWLKAMLRRG